jgi:cbb3-type cytochrome oxidase subunit 3
MWYKESGYRLIFGSHRKRETQYAKAMLLADEITDVLGD